MPQLRWAVLGRVWQKEQHNETIPSTRALAIELGYPTSTVRRSMEDLAAYDVLRREADSEEDNSPDRWFLSSWAREIFPLALGEE